MTQIPQIRTFSARHYLKLLNACLLNFGVSPFTYFRPPTSDLRHLTSDFFALRGFYAVFSLRLDVEHGAIRNAEEFDNVRAVVRIGGKPKTGCEAYLVAVF